MKTILVMGGNQFLGKAICEKLIKEKNKVYVINRGTRPNIDGVIFLKGDRNNEEELKNLTKALSVDIIIDVSGYLPSQVLTLQKVMKGKYYQYIFISSASVYENIDTFKLTKENNKTGGNINWGSYGKNKSLCEDILINNTDEKSKYTIFRPFYVYGVGNNLDRETYFFSRLKYNLPIFVPNDDKILLQFGYIDDLVLAIESSLFNKNYYNNIFNISGDEIISIVSFINICASIMKKEPNIRFIDLKKENISTRDFFPFRSINLFGDISKIQQLDFVNKTDLIKGLYKTYSYLEENELLNTPKRSLIEIEKS